MNYEEIKIIIFNISILSVLIYCIIMTIYNYKIGDKGLSILWIIIDITMIIVICFNHINLSLDFLNINKIVDISLIIIFPSILIIITASSCEKISLLFFSIAVSMFILFGSYFIQFLFSQL